MIYLRVWESVCTRRIHIEFPLRLFLDGVSNIKVSRSNLLEPKSFLLLRHLFSLEDRN